MQVVTLQAEQVVLEPEVLLCVVLLEDVSEPVVCSSWVLVADLLELPVLPLEEEQEEPPLTNHPHFSKSFYAVVY